MSNNHHTCQHGVDVWEECDECEALDRAALIDLSRRIDALEEKAADNMSDTKGGSDG